MSQVRCNGCRHWFDAKTHACPECGTERPAFNSWLKAARLNGHLGNMAASAHAEKVYADAHGI